MRLVFFGTPEFAVPSLEALVAHGHQIAAVVTQPDRPAGRGRQNTPPPVKVAAQRLGLPVRQPESIRTPELLAWLRSLQPEAMVVVGYGKLIPQSIIDVPPLGIVNVHASLLPKYRGAAPIEWAIARGETRTGVTTMRIDAGLDTGDILLQRETEIGPEETAEELRPRLAALGAELLIETLRGLESGTVTPRPQDSTLATYAPMLRKEDGRIQWKWTAREIANRVRAFIPWPGAYSWLRGKLIHIWRARPAELPAPGAPGMLKSSGGRLWVACGEATTLEILELQEEGRRRMAVADFLRGARLAENERFEETGS